MWRDLSALVAQYRRDQEDLARSGSYDPGAALARLTFLHNPHAAHPLDLRIGGRHDQHWAVISDDRYTAYRCIAEGLHCGELPELWEERHDIGSYS